MWYAYMATGDAAIYAYYSQCTFSGWEANNTSTSITVSGTVTLSANRSVINDLTQPPEPESIGIGTVNNSLAGRVTGVGGGSSALDTYLYYYSFLRTYQATQTISFNATLSFNSDTGVARYNLDITSTSPRCYGYEPTVSRYIMDQVVTMSSQTQPTSSYTLSTYVPGANEMPMNYDLRSNYLATATINLQIQYGSDTNGSPGGIIINFANRNYYTYQ